MTNFPSELRFEEEAHKYFYVREVPSVSRIMQHGGAGVDYSSVPPFVLERAAAIGTETHKAVELHLKGLPVSKFEYDRAEEYFDRFLKFMESGRLEPIMLEQKLMCEKYWYAGTIDITGYVDGRIAVVDVKTTSVLHVETVAVQASAYQHLSDANNPFKVQDRFALHLRSKGEELVPLKDRREEWFAMVEAFHGVNG